MQRRARPRPGASPRPPTRSPRRNRACPRPCCTRSRCRRAEPGCAAGWFPWPWTLNVAGTPQRHATRADACLALRSALRDTPAERIDVGLGQVNAGYHAHRVQRPCALLDPYRNLGIAAEILHEQYRPGEDWLAAVGRYHRPAGGPPAARYRGAVQRHLVRLLGNPQAMASLHPRRETTP